MSTYRELLQTAKEMLREQEIADSDVDAWYLLSHVFHINRTSYILNENKSVSEADGLRYLEFVKQRANHIPLQHITGTQEFMGLEFEVSPQVLIPRQDTEILVEEVLKISQGKSVLDMCTGSGCIIVSIAKLGNPTKATAVDISDSALEIAVRNAARHEVNVEFINSNLFSKVEGCYDIIVSNPPYIPTDEIDKLMPEVKNHEPVIALDGSEDGLYFYRSIVASLSKHLHSKGGIFFEIGHDQGEAVKEILAQAGFFDIIIKKDLSGLDRVVSARKP